MAKKPPPDWNDPIDVTLWGLSSTDWITPVAEELEEQGIGSAGINSGCIIVIGLAIMALCLALAAD